MSDASWPGLFGAAPQHQWALASRARLLEPLLADPPGGAADLLVSGLEEDAAAVLALAGPGEVRALLQLVRPQLAGPLVTLRAAPGLLAGPSAVTLLSLGAIGAGCGDPLFELPLPPATLLRVSEAPGLEPAAQSTLSLLAAALCAPQALAALVPEPPEAAGAGDPDRLAFALAAALRAGGGLPPAWDAFVAAFPAARLEHRAGWGHLVLAGLSALGLLGVPMAERAAELHRRLAALGGVAP